MTNVLFRLAALAMAATSWVALAYSENIAPNDMLDPNDFYNEGEEKASFEMIIKSYPIPVKTTTYEDFVFNMPDDLPELFHVVFGQIIIDQPKHLHHFVITGCPEKIDPELEGLPLEEGLEGFSDAACLVQVGGWAPGMTMFGDIDKETGVLMGSGMNVQSLKVNVHYTDGIWADEETQQHVLSNDGFRVHYTPTFRPYTSLQKAIIGVGSGPREMNIPAGEKRFFVSKNCKVESSCLDTNPEDLELIASFLGQEDAAAGFDQFTCANLSGFCLVPGEIGTTIKQLCPASCGFCDNEDGSNRLMPDYYRVTAVHYHAHLLGTEMYTTLLPNTEDQSPTMIQKQASARAESVEPKDLESREFWIFDNQETIPLQFDILDGSDVVRGSAIRHGDEIQTTCVYNSEYRDSTTRFGPSTYDEMCLNSIIITFDTPPSLLDPEYEVGALDIISELNLLTFNCATDERSDVYTGRLQEDEDARDIWKNHPPEDAEGCTFPVIELLFISNIVTDRVRNCPAVDVVGDNYICSTMEQDNMNFLASAVAGGNCADGNDGKGTTDETTETECLADGGKWNLYTCLEADEWLVKDGLKTLDTGGIDSILEDYWRPACCASFPTEPVEVETTDTDTEEEEEPLPIYEIEEDPEDPLNESVAASISAAVPTFVGSSKIILASATAIGAMVL